MSWPGRLSLAAAPRIVLHDAHRGIHLIRAECVHPVKIRDLAAPRPVTYNQACVRNQPGTRATDRCEELKRPNHLACVGAKLRATGEHGPDKHGDRTELGPLATAECLARAYKPSCEIDAALAAGNLAEARRGARHRRAAARTRYRGWADRQQDMLTSTYGTARSRRCRALPRGRAFQSILTRAYHSPAQPGIRAGIST